MQDDATRALSQEIGARIDHILTSHHAVHRADLASLVPVAERVEQVHADDSEASKSLARALTRIAREMEDRMAREEVILFPALRARGGAGLRHPSAALRADHAGAVALIRQLTRDLTPPAHACGAWRSLYGGTATLLDEQAAHIALENDVLFSRFEPAT